MGMSERTITLNEEQNEAFERAVDELERDETEVLVDDTVEGVVFNVTSESVVVRQKDANGPMVRVPKEDLDERLEVVG